MSTNYINGTPGVPEDYNYDIPPKDNFPICPLCKQHFVPPEDETEINFCRYCLKDIREFHNKLSDFLDELKERKK